MLFADDIVFFDEIRDELNDKLEKWRNTLKVRGFRFSGSKTEYLRCEFSGVEGGRGEVTMGRVIILKVKKFKYLGSIIEKRRDINDDINHGIRVGWRK